MPEFYVIFAPQKTIKMPEFLCYLPEKKYKISEFYICPKMPEFYIIIARKFFSRYFFYFLEGAGARATLRPSPSYAYVSGPPTSVLSHYHRPNGVIAYPVAVRWESH